MGQLQACRWWIHHFLKAMCSLEERDGWISSSDSSMTVSSRNHKKLTYPSHLRVLRSSMQHLFQIEKRKRSLKLCSGAMHLRWLKVSGLFNQTRVQRYSNLQTTHHPWLRKKVKSAQLSTGDCSRWSVTQSRCKTSTRTKRFQSLGVRSERKEHSQARMMTTLKEMRVNRWLRRPNNCSNTYCGAKIQTQTSHEKTKHPNIIKLRKLWRSCSKSHHQA